MGQFGWYLGGQLGQVLATLPASGALITHQVLYTQLLVGWFSWFFGEWLGKVIATMPSGGAQICHHGHSLSVKGFFLSLLRWWGPIWLILGDMFLGFLVISAYQRISVSVYRWRHFKCLWSKWMCGYASTHFWGHLSKWPLAEMYHQRQWAVGLKSSTPMGSHLQDGSRIYWNVDILIRVDKNLPRNIWMHWNA